MWSYGVVLWEIITMLEPFKEFDRGQQLVNIGRYRQKLFIPRSEAGFPDVLSDLLTRKSKRMGCLFIVVLLD